MDHHLRVRHPNGEFFEITHPVAADTSTLGPYRVISSASYYYFDATSSARAEMPWYVEDLDTGERIGPGPGQKFPDNDALIMWIAVMPPTNLTAHSGIHGIDLAWQPGQAATGGGFIIERRESMKTEGPFTPWHELARTGDGLPTWRDTRIAPGEYVIYRVRAFFGSGPNERHSAPSNRARAAMWIDRGGGIYGTPGGDDGTGPNSVVDPPGGDGGSGAGIPGDGDGDGDPDNDDDGVVDINDRYPNDPLRSDDVAVAFYGAIDLKKYPSAPYNPINPGWTSPIYGGSGPLMTIGDTNDVAWASVVDTGTRDPDHERVWALRIVGWADGALTCNVQLPLTRWGDMSLFGTTVPGIIRYTITPVGISAGDSTASPVVAGNVTASVWFLIPGSPHYSSAYISLVGTFEATSSGISWNVGSLSDPHNDLRSYSRLGHRYGIRRWKIHDSLGDHYHQRVTIDGVDLPFGDGPSESAYSLAISDLGYTVASIRHDDATQSFDGYYLCAPGASASRLPLTEAMVPMGVNDQRWVVGSRGEHDAVRGDLGFVLVGGVSLRTFHDLLPTEYQKQLRSAIPTMISNATQPGGKPRILFTAENYEGDPGVWVPRSLILHWDATGNPVVDRVMLPAAVVDPATHTVQELGASFAAWNKQQDFAALVGAPGGVPFPAILRPCPFQANRPFSEGFDPPMVGDVDPMTNERDEEDWLPWTSVAKSGTLSVNTRTKLLFPPGSPYWQHDIIAADKYGVPFSTPSLALATVDEDAPFAEETPLTIHGTPGGNDVQTAMILVRMNDSTQQVVWKMKVMVLRPPPSIGLKFYNEQDTESYVRPTPNIGIRSAAEIVAELTDRFASAGVSVHPDNSTWERESGTSHNGRVNFVLRAVLQESGIVLRGRFDAPNTIYLGYSYFRDIAPAEDLEGVEDTMSRVGAHEFGHFLRLSTRGKYHNLPPFRGHDNDRDPKIEFGPLKARALMRDGKFGAPGRWMRHEDWENANIKAFQIKP